jgi:hypothetical protein
VKKNLTDLNQMIECSNCVVVVVENPIFERHVIFHPKFRSKRTIVLFMINLCKTKFQSLLDSLIAWLVF